MAGWSSLPGDLVNLVADRLLTTSDLDSYMDLRAVCHGWRSATADPRKSPREPRFRPRDWVTLGEAHQSDGARLFVNAATGRFVRKDLRPVFQSYFLLVAGAGGGSLVLAGGSSPHAACLLNPFTGSFVQFAAPVPPELELELKVAAHVIGGSSPKLILLRVGADNTTIYWADPNSGSFNVFKQNHCDSRLAGQALVGGIYAAGLELEQHGSPPSTLLHPTVSKIMGLVKTRPPLTNDYFSSNATLAWRNCFLVESAGEILICFVLRRWPKVYMEVFKMATGSNALEQVKSIGNRAIFVGARRSLSVDADKFASVEANCIYYVHGSSSSYHVYNLEDEEEVRGGGAFVELHHRTFSMKACPSVVQLLCRYTSNVEHSQLGLELLRQRLREWDISMQDCAYH
ncbi:uncharacterized protein LOC120647924 [Panicum virgatum]|uniref:KIB1-4 beta-propeller domain-containing protein n=1 Tax=Panicum virgatum TaxID=38727 RepID=A0A8T0XAX0_PANVG|nr:uncharacterized protein LOC120647924 [Panicum virgatum]KAG2655858.1 hypothetical protein PVAP13_1KG040900 [Panicum virgatum]